jgi:putative endonuclease
MWGTPAELPGTDHPRDMPYMYILRCVDRTFYTGSSWDLERRLAQHQNGEGAEYTKRRLPVELVFAQWFDRIDEAYAMEKRVQGWSHSKRQALVDGKYNELPRLSKKDFSRRRRIE